MYKPDFIETNIEGVWLIECEPYIDMVKEKSLQVSLRFSKPSFDSRGLSSQFEFETVFYSPKGILNGLHYVENDNRLLQVLQGEVYYVVIDIRPDSVTKGKVLKIVLSENNNWQLYIPKGMVQGYLAMTDSLLWKKHEQWEDTCSLRGIVWNDPEWNIYWPFKEAKIRKPLVCSQDLELQL